ncbi:chloride channel [Aureococcus anophagefferens]|nr:chloride channel [Aureococcus anophagefferens]
MPWRDAATTASWIAFARFGRRRAPVEHARRRGRREARRRGLAAEFALRKEGKGSPHRASRTRVFDDGAETRVTLYRDSAAWCPYCQKLWMMLEEKEINYRRADQHAVYGDKPASFTAKVRGGILPALELDGTMYTESLDIMAMLDDALADGRRLLPDRPGWEAFEADAATEAAYHVIDNLDAVARFAARGRARRRLGPRRRDRAADPLATPAEGAVRDAVQDALVVASQVPRGLRRGRRGRRGSRRRDAGDRAAVRSAAYLRERVGVPATHGRGALRARQALPSPEKIVEAARSPRKRIKFRRGSDREPDDAADESEVEVSRDE